MNKRLFKDLKQALEEVKKIQELIEEDESNKSKLYIPQGSIITIEYAGCVTTGTVIDDTIIPLLQDMNSKVGRG